MCLKGTAASAGCLRLSERLVREELGIRISCVFQTGHAGVQSRGRPKETVADSHDQRSTTPKHPELNTSMARNTFTERHSQAEGFSCSTHLKDRQHAEEQTYLLGHIDRQRPGHLNRPHMDTSPPPTPHLQTLLCTTVFIRISKSDNFPRAENLSSSAGQRPCRAQKYFCPMW